MVVLQHEFIPGLSYSPELDKPLSTVISYHGPFFQQSPTYPGVFERSVQYGIYTSLQNKAIVHNRRVRPGNLLRGAGSAKEEHEEACELILRMGCFHIARNFLEQLGI